MASTDVTLRRIGLRIGLSVVLLNLFVIGLTGFFLERSQEQYFAQAATAAENLAHVIEGNIESIFASTDAALLSVVDEVDREKAVGGTNQRQLDNFMKTANGRLTAWVSIRVADARGNVVFPIPKNNESGLNVSDRDYFIALSRGEDPGLVVSGVILGKSTGQMVIVLGRRITDQQGQFAGIVFYALPTDTFMRIFSALDLGPQGSVTFYRADQSLIARYPATNPLNTDSTPLRLPRFGPAVQTDPLTHPVRAVSPVDGISRTFAIHAMRDQPLLISVGIADDDTLAPWRREAIGIGALTLLFSLITAIAGRQFFVRTQRQRLFEQALRASEELFRNIFDLSPVGMARTATDGTFLEANAAFCQIVGYSEQELLSRDEWSLSAKRYRDQDAAQRDSLARSGRYGPWEKEYIRPDGSQVPVRLSGARVSAAGGETFVFQVVEDISERRRAETEIQLAASVFHVTHEAIAITDAAANILSVNPAFTTITGFAPDDATGQNIRLLKSGRHDDAYYRSMWQTLLETGSWQGEYWNRRRDGALFLVSISINAIRNEAGEIERFVSVFSDITEQRQKDDQLKRQAHYDPLTGLANRMLLRDRLDQAIVIAGRNKGMVATLFLDLDRFKIVNDTLGHQAGDDLLKTVGKRLETSVRRSDTVARMGGDEFVIVLTDFKDTAEVAMIAHKIVKRLTEPMIIADQSVDVGCSLGIAMFPKDSVDAESALKHADHAMYAAKAAGRGTFCFFDAGMEKTGT